MWLVLPSAALGELHLCAQLTLTEPSAMAAQLAGLPFTLAAQLHTRLNGSETVWGDRLPPTPPIFDYSVLLEGESVASGQLRLDSPDGLSGGILSEGGNQSSLAHGELRVAGLRSAATGFERRTLRVELRREGCAPAAAEASFYVLQGWTTLLPPLLTLGAAVLTRRVLPSLLLGLGCAALLLHGYRPLLALLRTVDTHTATGIWSGYFTIPRTTRHNTGVQLRR